MSTWPNTGQREIWKSLLEASWSLSPPKVKASRCHVQLWIQHGCGHLTTTSLRRMKPKHRGRQSQVGHRATERKPLARQTWMLCTFSYMHPYIALLLEPVWAGFLVLTAQSIPHCRSQAHTWPPYCLPYAARRRRAGQPWPAVRSQEAPHPASVQSDLYWEPSPPGTVGTAMAT